MNIEPNNPSALNYGPFSLQAFDKTPWNHIKETLSDSPGQSQVHTASQHLLQFLVTLNSCSNFDQHFGDPSIKNFFFDDFLFKSIAAIVARNSFGSREIENIFNNCLQQTTFLWAKALEQGHFNLIETLKLVLNPFQPFYVTPFLSSSRKKGDMGFFDKLVNGLMSSKSSVPGNILNERNFITEVQQRIEFIEYLGINARSDYPLITYELLLGLWNEFVRKSFFKEEKNCIFRLVKNLAERNKDFLGDIMDLEKFFIEEMVQFNFRCDLRSTKEGLLCFKSLFLIINERHNNLVRRTEDSEFESEFVIKVFPEELIAFEMIWDIILLSQNQDALEGAIDLLATVYYCLDKNLEANVNQIRQACLDQIFQHIKEVSEEKKVIEQAENLRRQKCCRCLLVLDRMISESQINGLGDMKAHLQLAKGELIELTIKSYIHVGDTEISEIRTLTLNYNITVFELRSQIARWFKIWFDEVILMKDSVASQVEISLLENSRTLYEIGIKKDASVIARRRYIPKAEITMKDGSLNPRIIQVYKEWFENYSDHGKMSPEQFCGFAKMLTDDDIEPDGVDSSYVFQLYSYDTDNYLYFKAFYDLCEQIRQDNSDIHIV